MLKDIKEFGIKKKKDYLKEQKHQYLYIFIKVIIYPSSVELQLWVWDQYTTPVHP